VRFAPLVDSIRAVLLDALEEGGTTLRNYVDGEGNPGYFRQSLNVYERAGEPCKRCGEPIRERVVGQRATYFCTTCQR
jgi:formamidopyrimidine-DNA glycosylase